MIDMILEIIRIICLSLDTIVYTLVVILYNVFSTMASVNIFSNAIYEDFQEKILGILMIVAIFRTAVSLVQILIDPSKAADNKIGPRSILKKIVIVIALLVFTPSLFNYAVKLQEILIKEEVIQKIILGEEFNLNSARNNISIDMFSNFVYIKPNALTVDEKESGPGIPCSYYTEHSAFHKNIDNNVVNEIIRSCKKMKEHSNIGELMGVIGARVETSPGNKDYIFEYMWIIPFAVGIFISFMLGNYILSIGIRTIKLMVLQMISPLVIVSYLNPSTSGALEKWFKEVVKTYIKLFLLIGIVFFSINLGNLVFSGDIFFIEGIEDRNTETFIKIILFCSLLLFAKSAPDYILGLFGIEAGDDFKNIGNLLKNKAVTTAAGVATGALVGGVGNLSRGVQNFKAADGKLNKAKSIAGTLSSGVTGGLSGAYKGMRSGYSSKHVIDGFKQGGAAGIGVTQSDFFKKKGYADYKTEQKAAYESEYQDLYNKYNDNIYNEMEEENFDKQYAQANQEYRDEAFNQFQEDSYIKALDGEFGKRKENTAVKGRDEYLRENEKDLRRKFNKENTNNNLDKEEFKKTYRPLDKSSIEDSYKGNKAEFEKRYASQLSRIKKEYGPKSRIGLKLQNATDDMKNAAMISHANDHKTLQGKISAYDDEIRSLRSQADAISASASTGTLSDSKKARIDVLNMEAGNIAKKKSAIENRMKRNK